MVRKNNLPPCEKMHQLLKEYPEAYKYITSPLDSIFGLHTVYVALVRTKNNEELIKLGYTKNTVKKRFSESRYKGKMFLIEVIHEETFPSLGSTMFEKKLLSNLKQYNIKDTDIKAPGKGELFKAKHKDIILQKYNELKGKYKNIRGVKPPN